MISSAFTKLCAIKHPIALAPMAGVAGAGLAQAVSDAGGLGIVGGGYGDRGWLEAELNDRDCGNIGIGFITWRLSNDPQLLDVALAHAPKTIFLSFGDIEAFAPKIKAAGSLLIAQVQTVRAARDAAVLGADLIVAQGTEAGGHGSTRATLPLVPAVVDAVAPVPVLAAGGIADGRGLAAALMLGAAGIVMGTRFYCTSESLAPGAAKTRAINSGGDETVRSSVFDILREYDWQPPFNLRTVRNHMTDRFADATDELRADINAQIERFLSAVEGGNFDVAAVIAGEALDLVNDVPPAAVIMERTMQEALRCLSRPQNFSVNT